MYRVTMSFVLFLVILSSGCSTIQRQKMFATPQYNAVRRNIEVDADTSDWDSIKTNIVNGSDNLWCGQNLKPEYWDGNNDLSFTWRGAWYENKLFLLIEVKDDHMPKPTGKYSWENDCIEIFIDPNNQGGRRIIGEVDGVALEALLKNRLGRPIMGYEMHYLPTSPPKVFLNDTITTYHIENYQNNLFAERWNGQAKSARTSDGYLLEIGFSIPGFVPRKGAKIGLEMGICDDDGNGRESLMTWTGKPVSFWIDMDDYGLVTLTE